MKIVGDNVTFALKILEDKKNSHANIGSFNLSVCISYTVVLICEAHLILGYLHKPHLDSFWIFGSQFCGTSVPPDIIRVIYDIYFRLGIISF